jgi:hypothetical protein
VRYESRQYGGGPVAAADAASTFESLPTGVPGYCVATLPTLDGASNQNAGGGANGALAVHAEMHFTVSADTTWSFRFGPDAGWGGVLLIDGVMVDSTIGDGVGGGGFWDPSFTNPAAHFSGTADLRAGEHTVELYTYEGCCDGPWGAQYQAAGGQWLPITAGDPGPDADGDGFADVIDNCVSTANATQADGDGDGIGDVCDPVDDRDADLDGTIDGVDTCPTVPNPDQADLDGDRRGDVCDDDIDGDGVPNGADAFAYDRSESSDRDGDRIGDNADTDDDNDGVGDADDAFPADAAESVDTDHDGFGDNADNDDDDDEVLDVDDAFPTDAAESKDFDHDGIGNNADTDDDGDGVTDALDSVPLDSHRDGDEDNDGIKDTAPPTKADQCKKDGWKAFNNPRFKNQGDCVSYVSTGGKNPANG